MNVAFPAFLIFLLILPGIIFRFSYARGPWGWNNPTSFRRLSDELGYSIILAFLLHWLWIDGVVRLAGFQVHFEALLVLLTGALDPNDDGIVQSVAQYPRAVALYFFSLFAAAGVLGLFAHWVVRKKRLDLQWSFFRFRNEWYYLLTGEASAFMDLGVDADAIAAVYASAVVQQGGDGILYRGIVADFSYDDAGNLDRVMLLNAQHRTLNADRDQAEGGDVGRYYDIEGHVFILRYAEIRTLNLDYYVAEEPFASAA